VGVDAARIERRVNGVARERRGATRRTRTQQVPEEVIQVIAMKQRFT
jgi:hypothetical protein